jgi:hypothetical protein
MILPEVREGYNNKLKNRLYGLLCEFEKGGEWEAFLDAILIELEGIPEDQRSINYLSLYYNISSLRHLRYEYFRSTIFSCMSMLGKIGNEL